MDVGLSEIGQVAVTVSDISRATADDRDIAESKSAPRN